MLSQGRLYQVEYAMEGISHAGSAVGILTKEGIVLACEKKLPSKLLEESKTRYLFYYIFIIFSLKIQIVWFKIF